VGGSGLLAIAQVVFEPPYEPAPFDAFAFSAFVAFVALVVIVVIAVIAVIAVQCWRGD
jgi:hypothetical protein